MSSEFLDEKITALAAALEQAEIGYGFGGAIALAYYGTPRGTSDIDINVFIETQKVHTLGKVFAKLAMEKFEREALALLNEQGQLRAWWGHTPVDVFFAYDDFHLSCERRVRKVPFGAGNISVLSPEDLIVFKVAYGRDKDFREIREILLCMGEALDLGYIDEWLGRFVAPGDVRVKAFHVVLAERGLRE